MASLVASSRVPPRRAFIASAHTDGVSDVSEDELVPGLSAEVVEHLRLELGERAERVLRCLRTAAALIWRR